MVRMSSPRSIGVELSALHSGPSSSSRRLGTIFQFRCPARSRRACCSLTFAARSSNRLRKRQREHTKYHTLWVEALGEGEPRAPAPAAASNASATPRRARVSAVRAISRSQMERRLWSPVVPEAASEGELSAQMRRPPSRSAMSGSRRLATLDLSRRTSATRPRLAEPLSIGTRMWYQDTAQVAGEA